MWYGNWSLRMKFFIRNAAGSMSSTRAASSTRRSIVWTASVTRNEQRYATPPGGLFVYAASTSTNAWGMSYEPVITLNRPAGYFDGSAAASL